MFASSRNGVRRVASPSFALHRCALTLEKGGSALPLFRRRLHASPLLSSEKASEAGLPRSTSAQTQQQASQGASSPSQQQPDQPSLREQRRERRRELLEAAKHELEWRIIAARKTHDSEPTSAASSSVPDSTASDIIDAVASTNQVSAADSEQERKKEDLQRRIMRRRLRRAAREASRDPRLPENVWSAFGHYEVLLVKPTRTLSEVQKAVDEWYGHMSFRPNFKAELDMAKAAHVYLPFWHFACNTACQYQGRARIGRRFAAKYGEKTEGTLSTAFPVFICAEEVTPQRKPMLVQMDDLNWHEVWDKDRVVSLTGSESQMKQALDEYLQPTDRVVDVGLQPHAAWQKEGRKRLEEVEIQMSEEAIIKAELARGILKPLVKGDVREKWEVDLDYVARTDQEREQGMGKVQLVLVPAYQLNYRWRGYEYHLCVRDGDDPLAGPPALEGTRPYSYSKISLAGLGGLGVGFACFWLITH